MSTKDFLRLAALVTGSILASLGQAQTPKAYTGARIITGTSNRAIDNGVLVVANGRVQAVGAAGDVRIPANAEQISLAGKTIIPGLINAHGHVGSTNGLQSGPEVYTEQNVLKQLGLYARYGITTVMSLGDDGPTGIKLRDSQDVPTLNRARLYVAGPVLTATTPEEARRKVNEIADMKTNYVKFRVDDNLGTTPKMTPAIYRVVIDEAHKRGMRVATHMYYLEDARDLLLAGTDFLAHSVRDKEVDPAFIALLKERGVAVCPTLTREVSAYVYAGTPDFFKDPFFLAEADPAVVHELQNPTRQKMQQNPRAQSYKQALVMAQKNLKTLHAAGVPIVMGTDTGPAGRFQGYFEHLELELMVQAGLSPMDVLLTATAIPAKVHQLQGIGTLAPGNWADFVVLGKNPLEDIKNTRSIESVFIAGNKVPPRSM